VSPRPARDPRRKPARPHPLDPEIRLHHRRDRRGLADLADRHLIERVSPPMRLLVHGMQSSGATLFTYFLAQRPGCLALVDILNNYAAPRFESALDAVAKCVVTTAYPIAVHVERFRADKTILLLRDPRDNYFSLADKNYRNHSGLIDETFALLDKLFIARDRFDATVHYEDFLERDPAVLDRIRALGWPVETGYFDFERKFDSMLAL